MSVTKRDYYEVLGIDRAASDDEIKKAFRRLARQHHPDLQSNPQHKKKAEEKFKEANEAYEVLNNPESRKRYDTFGHSAGPQGFGGAEGFDFGRGFGDVFGDILKTSSEEGEEAEVDRSRAMTCNIIWNFPLKKRSKGKTPSSKSRDGKAVIPAKAREPNRPMPSNNVAAARAPDRFDCSRDSLRSTGPAGNVREPGRLLRTPVLRGRGQRRVYRERTLSVTIPAGIETGMRFRLAHEGEHGVNGGPPGDLYVAVAVKPHPVFTRKGNDIVIDLSLDMVTATLGGKIDVPTLKGKTSVKIPEAPNTIKCFDSRDWDHPP